MGVAHDDVLNLRAAPGASQTILETIHPTYADLLARGATRSLSSGFWVQVDYRGTVGWAHLGYLGYAGAVEDITADVLDEMGSRPSATTMTALGRMVAESLAIDEPPSDIVRVTPVVSGDLHEVSYDVVGFADDAIRGVRVHVFGEPTAAGFALRTVEMMVICGRGVDDGVCV
jgi:hypothetical protein